MSDYREVTETIEVPAQAGVEGFLAAIRKVLHLSRVTRVEIDNNGKVSYTRFVREEEPSHAIEINFDSVLPSAVVRNAEVQEIDLLNVEGASVSLALMFYAAAQDHLCPVGFVTGAASVLPSWYFKTTGVRLGQDTVYGLPLYRDRFLPDEVLLLVCAYSRQGSLVDVKKSYKILMPSREAPIRLAPPVNVDPPLSEVVEQAPLLAAHIPTDSEVKVIQ